MKAGIHPEYSEISATCSCGNVVKTKSTLGKICTWTYALLVTLSTLVSRKKRLLVVVSIALTSVSVAAA